jgi:hypothetical protein
MYPKDAWAFGKIETTKMMFSELPPDLTDKGLLTIAAQLGIEVGSPLLRLTRLVFDDTERPVEWLTALYRADRYAVRTALTHETIGQVSGWHPA